MALLKDPLAFLFGNNHSSTIWYAELDRSQENCRDQAQLNVAPDLHGE